MADLGAAYRHCETLVGTEDRERWLAALFVPAERRPFVHALDAWLIEVGHVRDRIRQPIAGEIRLQWWRDAVAQEARGDAEANPVAAALLDAVARNGLPTDRFDAILEAHRIALYGPPATPAELEDAADHVHGNAIRLKAAILGERGGVLDPAARDAGVALGIAALLKALATETAQGRAVLPTEVLARHGSSQAEVAAGRTTPRLRAALRDLCALARGHLDALSDGRGAISEAAGPAFLPAALVPPLLRRIETGRVDPFRADPSPPQWRRQWALWRAARRG